ncbi:hypothetical protein AYI68_g4975 [Smittium mucronatum]|uniref:Calcineurin-like phosphoesterase domain-containing protein n=1 Tax=Smittium mucronatum TaxID=133383 RepID=A0A1R0GVK2_9FUNG|nr:hypothetical protein AYI68_g4975 [Smittium mucronatum]
MKIFFLASVAFTLNFVHGFGKKCTSPSTFLLSEQSEINSGKVILKYSSRSIDLPDFDSEAKKNFWKNPGLPPKNLKVAIYGDLGVKKKSKRVLKMLHEWGVQGLILTGDYDYEDKPKKLERMFDSILKKEVPIFASIGNHDILDWSSENGYVDFFLKRLKRLGLSKNCTGEFGVNAICGWNGLTILLSGVGTRGYAHTDFAEDTLALSKSSWKICAWHKVQELFQIGSKKNQVGYEIYDMCRRYGAIVATSHVHAYSRTKLMTSYKKQKYLNQTDVLDLHVKTSFNIVSGMGGYSIDRSLENLRNNPWWAATVSKEDKSGPGAVLCTFHVDDDPQKARCEFRDIYGKVWDSWEINSHILNEPRPPRMIDDSYPHFSNDSMPITQIKNEKQHFFGKSGKPKRENGSKSYPVASKGSLSSETSTPKESVSYIGYNKVPKSVKSDFNEYPVDSNSDIAVGSFENGFDSNCNLNYIPTLKHDFSPTTNSTPIVAFRFRNLHIPPTQKITSSHLQLLRASQKVLHSGNYKYNHHDTFNTDLDSFFSSIKDRSYLYLNKQALDHFYGLKTIQFELRLVHTPQDSRDNKTFCTDIFNGGFDFETLQSIEPLIWEFDGLDHEIIHVSPNLASKITQLLNSSDWKEGDTITIFMNPTSNHLANQISSFVVYGHGLDGGCFSPTLDVQLDSNEPDSH